MINDLNRLSGDGLLLCGGCSTYKELDAFTKHNGRATKKQSWCRECGRAAESKRRAYRDRSKSGRGGLVVRSAARQNKILQERLERTRKELQLLALQLVDIAAAIEGVARV